MRNNPMSEARRQHLHGPLVPQHEKDLGGVGALICIASAIVVMFAIWSIFA